MSKLSQLRKKWNYETNVARCETCVHVIKPQQYLINSLPKKSDWQCKPGTFFVRAYAVCDNWKNAKGEVLE